MGQQCLYVCCDCLCLMALFRDMMSWGTLCTLHLKLIVAFFLDRYEVPPVILVLIPLTHWSTWSNSPWMTDLIS